MNIIATMQTGYNGWSVYVDTGDDNETERELCDLLEEEFPDITYEAYDEDGDCVGDPQDFEADVRTTAALLIGDREYTLTIRYDDFSS